MQNETEKMAAITVPEVPEKSTENDQPPQQFSAVDESDFLKLLGLAEFFRTSQPPRIRETIHCLQATLSIETLPAFEKARCRLNMAKLLLANTKNVGHARAQLEQAVSSFFGVTIRKFCKKMYQKIFNNFSNHKRLLIKTFKKWHVPLVNCCKSCKLSFYT